MQRYFGIGWLEFHDDWGTQISTMFSLDTYREMIAPYIQKVVEGVHSLGIIYEQHSCGKIETIIPELVATGADTWKGQNVNNKELLVESYGKQFRFAVEIRPEESLGDVETEIYVRSVLEKYRDKDVWYSVDFRSFTAKQVDMIYKIMRDK